MRQIALALLAAMLLGSAVLAQLKVEVALVNVVATVTDASGHYVPDLTPDDFIVQEDGQTQTISHLSQDESIPVSVGITLDTSGSMERKIATAVNAVERFVRTIHQDDDIFLLTFSDRPVLRQDFTSNRTALANALRKITVGGGTALYDALDESLRKIKNGEHDKKAILLITDGEDTSSMLAFDQAKLAVRESEFLVYCVGITAATTAISDRNPMPGPSPTPPTVPGDSGRFPGGGRGGRTGGTIGIPIPGIPGGIPFPLPIPGRRPYAFQQAQRIPTSGPGMNPDGADMSVLNAFADASGGKAWLLSGSWTEGRGNQVEKILDEIAAELRNQYSIGYYPSHPLQDGKWHRIEIRAVNPRYHVRARKEYFGK